MKADSGPSADSEKEQERVCRRRSRVPDENEDPQREKGMKLKGSHFDQHPERSASSVAHLDSLFYAIPAECLINDQSFRMGPVCSAAFSPERDETESASRRFFGRRLFRRQTIEDQPVKPGIFALKKPAQVLPAVATVRERPRVTREPAELGRGFSDDDCAGGACEAAELELDAGWIGPVMDRSPADGHPECFGRDRFTTNPADKPPPHTDPEHCLQVRHLDGRLVLSRWGAEQKPDRI